MTPEGPVGRLLCSSPWNGAFPLMGCVTTDLMDLVNYSPLRRDDLLCCPTGILCAALTALPVACPGLGRKPVAMRQTASHFGGARMLLLLCSRIVLRYYKLIEQTGSSSRAEFTICTQGFQGFKSCGGLRAPS